MKLKSLAIGLGIAVLSASCAFAETITTGDGVLSIETPDESWVQTTDPNYWFVISDGKNTITIDHLSNGEKLPEVDIAGSGYEAVYQAFVSTKNEVFVVKGMAAAQADLASIMETIGTVKVLKYDTKTAIQKETEASASQFGLRAIGATYYVTTDELNVRNGCSTDEASVGSLKYGEAVTVNGAVTKDGADFGWYQIQFNGGVAYVSSAFLSEKAPAEKAAEASNTAAQTSDKKAAGDGFDVFRKDGSYVGYLVPYSDGKFYIDGQVPFDNNGDGSFFGGAGAGLTVYTLEYLQKSGVAVSDNSDQEMVQCEFCGEWFNAGTDYRNHVSAAHPNGDQERVQCEFCGEWFNVGTDYRSHLAAAHPNGDQEMVQCEYCGEWFTVGNDYRNHVSAAHADQIG